MAEERLRAARAAGRVAFVIVEAGAHHTKATVGSGRVIKVECSIRATGTAAAVAGTTTITAGTVTGGTATGVMIGTGAIGTIIAS